MKDFKEESRFNRWVKLWALAQLIAFSAMTATSFGKMNAQDAWHSRQLIEAAQDS